MMYVPRSSRSWIVSSRHRAAVLDRVDAVLEHPANARVEGRVRRDPQPVTVSLVDDRVELFVRELERVVAAHDLDQVGAAANLLAHRTTHLVGARRLAATPVRVAAGLHDRLSADEQLRPLEDALGDRLLREEAGLVHAQVADGRYARSERPRACSRRTCTRRSPAHPRAT